MNDHPTNTPGQAAPRLRKSALLGTALALVLGGAFLGAAVLPNTSALAQAVRIDQPVQLPSFADIVEKVSPAVAGVRVRSAAEVVGSNMPMPGFGQAPDGSPLERFFRDFGMPDMPDTPRTPRGTVSMGSGFFISQDGYLVTNNHVVDGSEDFVVIMDNGTEYPARLIGSDDKTDLALLKVDADRPFTYVEFSKGHARVGDWVVAVGTPFGLGGTVTAGIVSGTGRQIGSGPYDDFLQIDAAVNRGNSGGPAFDLNGQVVGVNTAIFSPSGGNVGIAFAIPAAVASNVIDSLKEHGEVVRGWLGVQIQNVTPDIAASLGLAEVHGALVAEPQPGSPAVAAGLRTGDTILAVDGEKVADLRDLALKIGSYTPDSPVKLTIWRDGAEQELTVTLGVMPGTERRASLERPAPSPAAVEPSTFTGLGLELTPSAKGLTITNVDPNSDAAENGIQPGDVILSVGTTEVASAADVEAEIAKARDAGLRAVLFRIQSGDTTRFVAIPFAA